MRIKSVVEIKLSELDLHVEDGEFTENIDVELHYELDYDKLLFYLDSLEELELVNEAVSMIMVIACVKKENAEVPFEPEYKYIDQQEWIRSRQ